eukprot:jgi/Tetstr1/438127/TSEL_002853.t1
MGHVRSPVDPGARADSCTPESDYMRHQVRRNWQACADIGAGCRVVDMIADPQRRRAHSVQERAAQPATPFNQGVSMEAATPDKLRFMDDELVRFLASGGKTTITTIPSHSSGRSIYTRRVETAYMHVDIYCYGWGAVLDETTEARGF